MRDFTTLLLGYYFAERLAEDLGPGVELATFLKWEQLAAYARAVGNNDFSFRGTERVQEALTNGPKVTLSDDQAHQILGNQKIYGLWGLYTVPARASGLLDGDPPRLTAPARTLVEHVYLKLMGDEGVRDGNRIVELLSQETAVLNVHGADARLIRAVARVLKPRILADERKLYRFHLLHGGPLDKEATEGRQEQLATLLERTLEIEDFAWSPATVESLAKEARREGEAWHPLATRLSRIRACETVLAPMTSLFSFLLSQDGRSLGNVMKQLKQEWGRGISTIDTEEVRDLRTEFAGGDADTGDRWITIAEAARRGDWRGLVSVLIDQNRFVMKARGGTEWLEIKDDRLHARFRDEEGQLPPREALASLWRFPYFIDSVRAVAHALVES